MKIILLFSLLLVSFSNLKSADIYAGAGIIYSDDLNKTSDDLGLELKSTILDRNFGLAGNFHYFFTPANTSFFTLDFNFQINYFRNPQLRLYQLTGINYCSKETLKIEDDEQITIETSDIGLNLGTGLIYDLDGFSLNPEAKFVISDADQLVISVSAIFPL